jgi:hypothetical protein
MNWLKGGAHSSGAKATSPSSAGRHVFVGVRLRQYIGDACVMEHLVVPRRRPTVETELLSEYGRQIDTGGLPYTHEREARRVNAATQRTAARTGRTTRQSRPTKRAETPTW